MGVCLGLLARYILGAPAEDESPKMEIDRPLNPAVVAEVVVQSLIASLLDRRRGAVVVGEPPRAQAEREGSARGARRL